MNAFEAYKNMFTRSVILEADEDIDLELDIENEGEPKEKPANEEKPEVKKPATEKTEVSSEDAELKFSIDLATEFSNTINEFTNICAKIVEKRIIDKELADRFYDSYAKIKNLADAASRTK
jgi:hypothetical protein